MGVNGRPRWVETTQEDPDWQGRWMKKGPYELAVADATAGTAGTADGATADATPTAPPPTAAPPTPRPPSHPPPAWLLKQHGLVFTASVLTQLASR